MFKTAAQLLEDTADEKRFEDFQRKVEESDRYEWDYYGTNGGNTAGAQNANSKERYAVVELITNAYDATIDLVQEKARRELRKKTGEKEIPDEAVREKLGYEDAFEILEEEFGMPPKFEPTEKRTFRTEDRIEPLVILSGEYNRDHTTIDVIDRGVGMHRNNIENTIMKVMGNAKIERANYAFGAFGQGRTSALQFAEGSVVVSKHAFGDEIVATIMRKSNYDLEDGTELVAPQWHYVVDKQTGQCPVVESGGTPDFMVGDDKIHPRTRDKLQRVLEEHGTVVRHVGFDLPGNSGWSFQGGRGLYNDLDEHYPGAPLKIEIEDLRFSSREPLELNNPEGNEVVSGIVRKAAKNDTHFDSNWVNLSSEEFESGSVRFRVMLMDLNENSSINKWVHNKRSGPVMLHGQYHGSISRKHIKKEFPYLAEDTLILVDLDDLPSRDAIGMIKGNREALIDKYEKWISESVVDYMSGVAELRKRNEKRKQEARKERSTGSRAVCEEIVEEYNTKTSEEKTGNWGGGESTRRGEPITQQPEDWFFDILGDDIKDVYPNANNFVLNTNTNIPKETFGGDALLVEYAVPEFVKSPGENNDNNMWCAAEDGYGPHIFNFRCKDDAEIGDIGELVIKVMNHRGDVVAKGSVLLEVSERDTNDKVHRNYDLEVSIVDPDESDFRHRFADNPEKRLVSIDFEDDFYIRVFLSTEHPMIKKAEKAIENRDAKQSRETVDRQIRFFREVHLTRYAGRAAVGFVDRFDGERLEEISMHDDEKLLIDDVMESALGFEVRRFVNKPKKMIPGNYE